MDIFMGETVELRSLVVNNNNFITNGWNLPVVFDMFWQITKNIIIFVMSVHLSIRIEQLGSHWTDYH